MTFFPTGQGLMGGLRNAGGFIFGEGADAPTYDALKRKREIANLLMAQTMQQPVNNWGDGVGKVLSALGARMMDRRLAGQEKADQDAAGGRLQEIISALGGGGGMGLAGMSSSGGAAMPPRDPGTAPQGYSLPSGDPDWESIKAGIFAGESGGDYDALFGYSNRPGGQFQNYKLTDMTVDDAIRFSDPGGAYGQWVKGQVGRVATPMGAYQVVGTTLRGAKEGLGLTGEERMTPEVQDAIGRWIYQTQGTGAWEGYRGPQDPASVATRGGGGYQQPGFDPAMAAELGELIPRLPEGQRAVAQALLAQSLSQGTAMTPYQQAQLANDAERLRLDQMRFERDGQAQPTDDMREYEYAQGQGYTGSFQDFMVEQRRAGASTSNVTLPGQTPAYANARQGQFATQMAEIEAAERAASGTLSTLNAMEGAMADPGFYSGSGGQTVMNAKRLGRAMGLDVEGVESMEQFNSLASKAVLDAIGGSLGAQVSNSDREFIERQTANLSNTPEGNRLIIDMHRSLAQRRVEVARMAREYERENGQLDAGFSDQLSAWVEQNPLFKGVPEAPPPPAAASIPQAAIDAGIDPDLWQFMSPEDQALWQN